MLQKIKGALYAVTPTALVLSPAAFAQTGTDYGSILDGLETGNAVTGMLAAGALIAVVGFGAWIIKKVARFFG